MKAYTCTKYGPPEVLKLIEVEKPVPKEDEMLVKIMATTVNGADSNTRGLRYIPTGLGIVARLMLGFTKPKYEIIGTVYSGVVEEVGDKVSAFKPGDKIFGSTAKYGTYAEYKTSKIEGSISHIPENITFEEAAAVPYGALTALYFLRNKANIQKGMKVLVKGASGGVGVYAVQLAYNFGAEVTAVCSRKNMKFVESIGAHKVIDYAKEDYLSSGETWDIIFDVVVGKTSFSKNKKCLNPKGYYLAVAGGLNDMLSSFTSSIFGSKKVIFGGGSECEIKENLDFIAKLIEEEKIKPIVDKVFPFEQMVEAHRHSESGNKRGSVAVKVI